MKKVIDLFKNEYTPNNGENYSELLEEFITKFNSEFEDFEYFEDIIQFAMVAWNFGNMKTLIPKEEFNKLMSGMPKEGNRLFKKMVAHKAAEYERHTSFIVDFELGDKEDDSKFSVITQTQEDHLDMLAEGMENEPTENDLQENYIDRSAIMVKPLQPFLDWYYKIYPEDMGAEDVEEANTYLLGEDVEDLENWLKKKYDRIFKLQLEDYHDYKKDWPKKRDYKMFRSWFHVEISTMVYDLERRPVVKS